MLNSWIQTGRRSLRRAASRVAPQTVKHLAELYFWHGRRRHEGRALNNRHYGKLMLAMAKEPNDNFLASKVVADFGCGPRGSLSWVGSAKECIGLDVLAHVYESRFDLRSHGMTYVRCTEERIPLNDCTVDVLFTVNALDHVLNLRQMCAELRRILRPGGLLIGSFNLHEPPTASEPQELSEELLNEMLFGAFVQEHRRVAPKGGVQGAYGPMYAGEPLMSSIQPAILWFRGRKVA